MLCAKHSSTSVSTFTPYSTEGNSLDSQRVHCSKYNIKAWNPHGSLNTNFLNLSPSSPASRKCDAVEEKDDFSYSLTRDVKCHIDKSTLSYERVECRLCAETRVSIVSPHVDRPCILQVPVVIAMVGLPARGKTFIANKLCRFLNWIGLNTKMFNVGSYRRSAAMNVTHEFFKPDNLEAQRVRQEAARSALEDMCEWLEGEGNVAVFDATNSTRERRDIIQDICAERNGYKLLFVESICNDLAIIEANIMEVKTASPDYECFTDCDLVMADFQKRIQHYKSIYEPMDEECDKNLSFIKIFDQGDKFLVNKITGYVESKAVYYLMNIHVLPRTIYITRHGESELNLAGRIGGDSDLSTAGQAYARALASYLEKENIPDLHVWTSTLKRTVQTADFIDAPKQQLKALNEIYAGVCEGMTYDEIGENFPDDFSRRDKDKYNYRYPGGESYQDLVQRLEPVIIELERLENVLVVCHQAVARCLLAYFLEHESSKLPYINVPLHTVIKLTPVAYGCRMEMVSLNIPAVNTYRSKPSD